MSQREGRNRKRLFKGKSSNRGASPAPQLGTWGASNSTGPGGRRSRSLGHGPEKLLTSLERAVSTSGSMGAGATRALQNGRKRKASAQGCPAIIKVVRSESEAALMPGERRGPSPRRKRTPRDMMKRSVSNKNVPKKVKSSSAARRDGVGQELIMQGSLKLQYRAAAGGAAMEPALFWCTFRHPCLYRFINQEDELPAGVAMVSSTVQVAQQSTHFTLSYASGERYEFIADTLDEATLWTICLRKAIAAAATPSSSLTRTLSKTGLRNKSKKLSKTTVSPRTRLYARMPLFESACTDLAFILKQYDFSPSFMAKQEDDGFFHVQSGKIPDLCAWFLIHSTHEMKANRDFSSFLLSSHRYCTPEDFVVSVKYVWGSKLRSFPYGLDARLVNFLRQYLLAPHVYQCREAEINARKDIFKFCSQELSGQPLQSCFAVHDLLQESPNKETGIDSPTLDPVDEAATARILQLPATDLVQLLTELDEQIVSKVNITEFLDQKWQKNPELAPGLTRLASNFNKTSCWVAHVILMQPSHKERARVFTKFVRVAKQLLEICNYQTCAAVLSGLKSQAVERLKGLQEELKPRHLERVEKLAVKLSPEKNYGEYRALPTGPPCIPFLAVHLRDLTFIDEGNKWFINTNKTVCNFVKADLMATCLRSIKLDKTEQYCFQCDTTMLSDLRYLINTAPNEEELHQSSVVIEPFRSARSVGVSFEEGKPPERPSRASSRLSTKVPVDDKSTEHVTTTLEARVKALEEEKATKTRLAADLVSSYRIATRGYNDDEASPRTLLNSLSKNELIDLLEEVLSWNESTPSCTTGGVTKQTLTSSSTGSLCLGDDSDDEDDRCSSPTLESNSRVDVRKGLAPQAKCFRIGSAPANAESPWG